MRSILFLGLSFIASVGMCEDIGGGPPNDLSYVEEISPEDLNYIIAKINDMNILVWGGKTLFLDGLESIDKAIAQAIGAYDGSSMYLGIDEIDKDSIVQLLHNYDKKLCFNRLEALTDENIDVLLNWRGELLIIPKDAVISETGMKKLKTRFHTWKLQLLTTDEIQEQIEKEKSSVKKLTPEEYLKRRYLDKLPLRKNS